MSDGTPTETPSSAKALDQLVSELRDLHGESINAVLYYGSSLRTNNPFEGIVDLFLIVDHYSDFYTRRHRAFLNWLLPPDVFYREVNTGEQIIRVKYNVLSIRDLRRGLTGKWFHPYLWGRFVQPTEQLWCRDEATSKSISTWFTDAVKTFLVRVLPMTNSEGRVAQLWQTGMQLSYAAELRSESPNRPNELVAWGIEHYVEATVLISNRLPFPLVITGEGKAACYATQIPYLYRLRARFAWELRRLQGRALSIARLLKALFTFEGGLDYVAWKLSRHSGKVIEIPDKVRRYPLIFIWQFMFTLYRQGIIR